MTYVYNDLASEIKRKPSLEEIELVEKHHIKENELYKKYNTFLEDGTKEIIDTDAMNRLWKEYLNELYIYNDLFNKYMGYCY